MICDGGFSRPTWICSLVGHSAIHGARGNSVHDLYLLKFSRSSLQYGDLRYLSFCL